MVGESTSCFRLFTQGVVLDPGVSITRSKVFVVETDASSSGLWAVLMQEHHQLPFISMALSSRRQSLSVYMKELLAILFAVKQ